MKNVNEIIHEQIAFLKVEIEQNKDRGRWANCLSLSGGVSALQSLASDIAAQQDSGFDQAKGCDCPVSGFTVFHKQGCLHYE